MHVLAVTPGLSLGRVPDVSNFLLFTYIPLRSLPFFSLLHLYLAIISSIFLQIPFFLLPLPFLFFSPSLPYYLFIFLSSSSPSVSSFRISNCVMNISLTLTLSSSPSYFFSYSLEPLTISHFRPSLLLLLLSFTQPTSYYSSLSISLFPHFNFLCFVSSSSPASLHHLIFLPFPFPFPPFLSISSTRLTPCHIPLCISPLSVPSFISFSNSPLRPYHLHRSPDSFSPRSSPFFLFLFTASILLPATSESYISSLHFFFSFLNSY